MTLSDLIKSPFAWATSLVAALGIKALVPFLTANAGTLFAGWSLVSLRVLPAVGITGTTRQQLLLGGVGLYLVFLLRRLWLRWRARNGGTDT